MHRSDIHCLPATGSVGTAESSHICAGALSALLPTHTPQLSALQPPKLLHSCPSDINLLQLVERDVQYCNHHQSTASLAAPSDVSLRRYTYLTPPSAHLLCCICSGVFAQPTVHRTCGNVFCHDCLHGWMDDCHSLTVEPTCPLCRSPCDAESIEPAPHCIQALVDELPVRCMMCNAEMDVEQYGSHVCWLERVAPAMTVQLPPPHSNIVHVANAAETPYGGTVSCVGHRLGCTWQGTISQQYAHVLSCQSAHLCYQINGLQDALHLAHAEADRYRAQHAQSEAALTRVTNELINQQLVRLEELTLQATSIGTRLISHQANWLLASASRVVDTFYQFCQHILTQSYAIRTRTIRIGLQPELLRLKSTMASLRAVCRLMQQHTASEPLPLPTHS